MTKMRPPVQRFPHRRTLRAAAPRPPPPRSRASAVSRPAGPVARRRRRDRHRPIQTVACLGAPPCAAHRQPASALAARRCSPPLAAARRSPPLYLRRPLPTRNPLVPPPLPGTLELAPRPENFQRSSPAQQHFSVWYYQGSLPLESPTPLPDPLPPA